MTNQSMNHGPTDKHKIPHNNLLLYIKKLEQLDRI